MKNFKASSLKPSQREGESFELMFRVKRAKEAKGKPTANSKIEREKKKESNANGK